MARDIIPEVGALLDGLTVTQGSYSRKFKYVPWGRHKSRDYHPDEGDANGYTDVITVERGTHPKEDGDTGGGVDIIQGLGNIHAFWPDLPTLVDPDEFVRSFEQAVADAVHVDPRNIGDSFWTQLRDIIDDTDLIRRRDKTGLIRYHVVIPFEARIHDVWES